jgi:hypothetical protein
VTYAGVEDTGNALGFVAGLIVAGIGPLVALIGAIAEGVYLGQRKWAREQPSPATA